MPSMNAPLFASMVLGLASPHVLCQVPELKLGAPASRGCDAAALEAAAQGLADVVQKGKALGVVAMVVRGDTVVLHEAYGSRDLAKKQPMQKDTLFRMASNTKAVTAAAILSLIDDGKLELDHRVSRWLPNWAAGDSAKVTVRQLLTHSSGLRISSLFLRPLMKKSKLHPEAPTLVLECERFGMVGPEVEPGTSYSYSNPGYNTLAAIVEVASGKGFEAYCKQRFYDPLGMRDTCNHESRADHSRMSVVARVGLLGSWTASWSPGDDPNLPFVRGSGGMISTAPDFARFCRMLLSGGKVGEHRYLASESVRAATTDQIPHIKTQRYGFGWVVDAKGGFSHGGSDGTWAWCDPARDLVGLVFAQTQRSAPLNRARQQFRRDVSAACPVLEKGAK